MPRKQGPQAPFPVQQVALTVEQDRVLFILLVQWQAYFANALLELPDADITRPEALAFIELAGYAEDEFWKEWQSWQA